MKRLVIITDCRDVAYSEMKWSIESACQDEVWSNLSVDLVAVREFSVLNAAFLTRLTAELCGEETLIWVVINPQKTRSDRIFGKTKKGVRFFGANTGALTWLIRDQGVSELYKIDDPGFITFGGKFVHSPNVSQILSGVSMSTLGSAFDSRHLTELYPSPGEVVHIDNFGLIKIFGDSPEFDEGEAFEIAVNNEYAFDAKYSRRMMNNEDGEWILFAGSSLHALPELGAVRNNEIYRQYNIKVGDKISWTRKQG